MYYNAQFPYLIVCNILCKFFAMLDEYFPPSNKYGKIFDWLIAKFSYSNIRNLAEITVAQNKQRIREYLKC